MTRRVTMFADDRGAVLVYAAVVMVGLMAMATFVVDFGMFWVARQQAQNSADAAAYAAAIALGQDTSLDKTADGAATQTALVMARKNLVWDEVPSIAAADVTFPACPVDGTDMCVRVAVYRSAARGNALPTVFGRLVGLTTQDVQAVATAEVRPGNVNKCIKPWAIPDRWNDVTGLPTRFEKYDAAGALLAPPDQYAAPSAASTGTGYRLSDLGAPLTLSQNPGCTSVAALTANPACQAQPGNFLPVKLSGICPGSTYLNTIVGCTACAGVPVDVVGINDPLLFSPSSVAGLTQTGAAALVALDPSATFNLLTKRVENSCVGGGGVPYSCKHPDGTDWPGLVESPRIVAVPAYDVNWFEDHRRSGVATVNNLIRISNILSVFVDSSTAGAVTTHLVTKSGGFDGTKGAVTGGSAFTRTLLIVR